ERGDADQVPRFGQVVLDVVDGEIALAHGDGQVAHRIAGRGIARAGACRREEVGPFGGVMAELVTKGAKSAGRVAEPPGDFGGRETVDEVGAQGLVLALAGPFGGKEEMGFGASRERNSCTGSHGVTRLQIRRQLASSWKKSGEPGQEPQK